jgi:DNA-binding ferritin-like protein
MIDRLKRPGSVDKEVADLVFELLHSSTKTHITHLLVTGTGSYAAHKALNEFYDDIVDLADDIAEQYQGVVEKVLDYPDVVSIPQLKTKEDAIVYLRGLYNRINILQSKIPYSEIINQLDEVKSLIGSTKYKLILLG